MNSDLLGRTLALLSAFLWAAGVIFFKRAGKTFPPLTLNLFKTAAAALLLLPMFFVFCIPLVPGGLAGKDWLIAIASGVMGITVADSLFFVCLNRVGAGLAAIAECLYSPFVMLFSWLVLAEAIRLQAIVGAGLVISGVFAATWNGKRGAVSQRDLVLGMCAGAGAMLVMGLSIVLMKPLMDHASILWITEIRALAAAFGLLLLQLGSRQSRTHFSLLLKPRLWGDALPGTIFGSVLSMTAWVAAFSLTDVTSAAILNQTNTIIIVVLASVWLKEPFTRHRLLATLLAVSGSVLVLLP